MLSATQGALAEVEHGAKHSLFSLGDVPFDTIGTNENIPEGIVTALAQDDAGFVWIGSQEGLIRFDGYRYKHYQHNAKDSNSLSADSVLALWNDGQGKIWIGTATGGVSVLEISSERFTHYSYDPKNSASLSNNAVRADIKQREREQDASDNANQGTIGLLLLDIDFFKLTNDEYGHGAGDQVLIQFSQILQDTCRESDWIMRWGGEEFLVICRSTSFDELEVLAERMRRAVEEHAFVISSDKAIHITCSIGFCSYPFVPLQRDFFNLEQSLHLADCALYASKEQGRNTATGVVCKVAQPSAAMAQAMLKDFAQAVRKGYLQLVVTDCNKGQ